MDTRGIELQVGPIEAPHLHTPGCVNMGNPHVVFFVPDAEAAPVRQVGPMIEHHPLFPERTNVGFAQIKSPDQMRLRVWERARARPRPAAPAPARPWSRPTGAAWSGVRRPSK